MFYNCVAMILSINMTTVQKFEVEILKGTRDFSSWPQKMRALLLQQRFAATLDGTWATRDVNEPGRAGSRA